MNAGLLLAPPLASSARAAGGDARAPEANSAFGAPRTLIVSVERVSPLVVLEADRTGRGRIEESRTLVGTLGETPTAPPPERLPRLALDYGVGGDWTVGGSMHVAHVWSDAPSLRGDDLGIAPRVGRAIRLGKSAVFWPRIGVSYNALRTETGTDARVVGSLDAALAFFPTQDVALTLTPALEVGLASSAPAAPGSTGRFAVTVGLTTALDADDTRPEHEPTTRSSITAARAPARAAASAPARALTRFGRATLSADRLLPLIDYAKPDGGDAVVMSGTSHVFTRDRALYPRFAADFTLFGGLTFGTSFAFNLTPWENVETSAYPQGGRLQSGPRANLDLHALSIGVEPRVGVVRALTDNVAIWVRGGLTYEASAVLQQGYHAPVTTAAGTTLTNASYDGRVAHRLNLSADPVLVVFITSGFGVTVGPVLDVTLFAHGSDPLGYPHGLPGGGVFHIGAVAGALLSF